MENTALVGLSAQVALRRELDVVANNIANLNTTGYKADAAAFEEYLSPVARENRFAGADRRLRFVQDRATWHDLGQGALQQTGNPLDLAIDGTAFFAVQTPRGERYTRAGALQIDAQGRLVTVDGSPVLGDAGPIVFQPLDRDIVVTADGRITVAEGANNKTESLRGKLRLVGFAQPARLQKDGANTFLAPQGMAPQVDAKAKVVQGALEKSNVNGVLEMTRLIEITRSYTQISNLLQQQSELRKSTLDRLADATN
jgi:flagellar basal-body rod protein FlgF/flagellar basal-body rod protein FlgG